MKKVFIFICLFVVLLPLFCETDISIFSQVYSSYSSEYYPGAVQYAEQLEAKFPDSSSIGQALLIKGESQVRLNLCYEAEKTLIRAKKYNETNPVLQNDCDYWLARAYDMQQNYDDALKFYYSYCKKALKNGVLKSEKLNASTKYYPSAILNSGRVFYKKNEYKNAVPNFEYIVQNGKKIAPSDYVDALLKLTDCYNKLDNPKKSIALFNSYKKSDFDDLNLKSYVYYLFMMYAGDSYVANGEYKKAYDLYCEVLESGEKALASNALMKAYNVSSKYKTQVGQDAGTVLQNAQKTLADSPELLSEFWTRLAVDAYVMGDYQKSLSYFDEAEKNASVDLFLFASLYRAQIAAGKNPTKKSAEKALNMILSSREILNEENQEIFLRESNILLAKYSALQNNWDDVINYSQNVVPLDVDTKNYLGIAYYNKGEYQKAAIYSRGQHNDLQALSLAKCGDLKNAAFIYSEIENSRELSDTERLNYSKILLSSGRYRESQIEAAKCKLPEAFYVLALAQFNTWSWPYAEENFKKFLAFNPKKTDKATSYATFYLGYSQYRQGKTKEAYSNLANFANNYKNHELYWNGLMVTASSAIQNNNNVMAEKYAGEAVKVSANDAQKQESVLLLAEIYCDGEKYKNALDLLFPYERQNNEFGLKSGYKIAQIYEIQNQSQNADAKYKEVATKFGEEKLAEEAMYRRGEIFYNAEDYVNAISRFDEYAKRYSAGSFVDSAWYFIAESYAKLNNSERAILQNQALIKKFPQSTYVYSSAKNLISLYRKKGDYDAASEMADFLVEKYGEQAKNDGITKVQDDLAKLSGGKSEEIVKKEEEFKSFGEISSAKGRKIGTELVALYMDSEVYARNATVLAEKLLPVQKKNIETESLYAAQNAKNLGFLYRKNNLNKESASMYLLAAEYFRMNNKSDEAASSLYGAYDSFSAAGFLGDSNETARLLRELYPQSRYAKSVKIR